MIQQVEVQTYTFDRATGKSGLGPKRTVTIEIDVVALAQLMYTKGRKTIADGLVKLVRS